VIFANIPAFFGQSLNQIDALGAFDGNVEELGKLRARSVGPSAFPLAVDGRGYDPKGGGGGRPGIIRCGNGSFGEGNAGAEKDS